MVPFSEGAGTARQEPRHAAPRGIDLQLQERETLRIRPITARHTTMEVDP